MSFSPSQNQSFPTSLEFEDEAMTDATPASPHSPTNFLSNPSYSNPQPSNSGRANGDATGGASSSGSGSGNAKVNYGAPGSSWTSKKYQDELDKTKAFVLDAGWDGRKYGDPLIDN